MTEPLPRRQGRAPEELWLPLLGPLIADEALGYHLGAIGPKGTAWLRAWDAADGVFAIVTWIEGLDLAEVARPLRYMLGRRFGSPFALAELSPGSLDLVLAPEPGEDQAWLRLWPPEPGRLATQAEAWWAVCGDTVLSS